MVDIFFTHCQHPHMEQRKALSCFAEPYPRGKTLVLGMTSSCQSYTTLRTSHNEGLVYVIQCVHVHVCVSL